MTGKLATLTITIGLLVTAPAYGGSILLGSRTLAVADDLTAVQADTGHVLEWLDLSATDGLAVDAALSTYAPQGFRWASGQEVSELYSAWGISYVSASNARVSLDARADAMENFVNYFGYTQQDDPFLRASGALGWINDLTTSTSHTYSCLSVSGGCAPFSFVQNMATSSFWPRDSRIGVYLVRDAQPVPEPATVVLLGIGVASLVATRKRTRSSRARQETSAS